MIMMWMRMLLLQTDHSSSYLRAARAGNYDKLVDLLDSGKANITTTNAASSLHSDLISSVCLSVCHMPVLCQNG